MGRGVGCKLSQEQARALHRSHGVLSLCSDMLPFEGELLCRYNNFGKKIPFVNMRRQSVQPVLRL